MAKNNREMTTADRIEKVKNILTGIICGKYDVLNDGELERVVVQLLNICQNQQQAIDMLTTDYAHRLEQKLNQQDNGDKG